MPKKKTTLTSDQKKAVKLIQNALSLLGVDSSLLVVTPTEKHLHVQLDLPEEETGIFIGHRGESLSSLQFLLSLLVSHRLGDWHRVRVNVGDYQERRLEALLDQADQAVERALTSGNEVVLPNLNSFERRQVHLHLENNPEVTTESRGIAPYRQLIISPKQ